ncbi:response regulator [uncultured Sphaerochaeta sp.]|uniref:response regulator n=1 Tax=uncultured Sphaerochaeta sp. TaxID=886478 RepID=UPI002A0A978D|nr:response regulator [uncultured Sphaerochaeta sp.]
MNEQPATDISILIVDDETIIRQRIALHLQRAGYSIVGFAKDGREASQLLISLQPDIVITDIAMPFVSGIELLKQAREEGNTAKFIFITGYNEFDFALTALKNKATDYLLKPIDPSQLIKAAERACKEIAFERKQQNLASAYANLKESAALYRFLSGEDLSQLFSSQLSAILQHPQTYRLLLAYGTEPLEPVSPLHYLLPNGLHLVFLKAGTTDLMNRFPRDQWYLALGKPLSDVEQLRSNFPLLRRTLLQRFFTPEVHVYYQENYREALSVSADFSEENRELIRQQQYFRLRELLAKEVRAIDNPLALESYTADMALLFGEFSPDAQRFPWKAYSPLWILERFTSLSQYIEYLQNVASSLFPETEDTSLPLVERVRSFLLANYPQPQLNLETIGLQVFAHPNYVSTRFKEETGSTVIEYLTSLRLEQAKALLQTTQLSCKQIALSVGFLDSGYFSKCFKKQYGYSPKNFQDPSN